MPNGQSDQNRLIVNYFIAVLSRFDFAIKRIIVISRKDVTYANK